MENNNTTNTNSNLKHFIELFLNWNYNSDIISIICEYIHLKPIDKIRYYDDQHHNKRGVMGLRGFHQTPYRCNHCNQLCYNQRYQHDLECKMMTNCDECGYSGTLNSEYIQHKQNTCPTTLIRCEYCNMEGYRQNMYHHYNSCNKVFKCDKCDLVHTKDNENLHKLLC